MTEGAKTSEAQSGPEYTRLHITPLNPALLPSIVPPAVLPFTRNISYHSLQSFPEKNFGFLDLPLMEAEKIKKRLNGAILKGTKVKIENARPSKLESKMLETTLPALEEGMTRSAVKKRKRDAQIILAVGLEDRQVKRGWTDPAAPKKSEKRSRDKKNRRDAVKSKYTSNPECLFRTTLPANVEFSRKGEEAGQGLKDARKKRKTRVKDVIVHEFSRTTKYATFLRSSQILPTAKGVAEYVDGKGWVDQDGKVVEGAIVESKRGKDTKTIPSSNSESLSDTSENGELEDSSEDDVSEDEHTLEALQNKPATLAKAASGDSSTSSSGSSSDDEDEFEKTNSDETSGTEQAGSESVKGEVVSDLQTFRLPATPLKIDIPKSAEQPEPTTEVHPLEALFKRRRPDSMAPQIAEEVPAFSFFDGEEEDEGPNVVVDNIPMTPFTKQDFAIRGLRSAAPTPDTAYPSKSPLLWPSATETHRKNMDGAGAGDGQTTPTKTTKTSPQAGEVEAAPPHPTSDFQKWFYEHRGETNRAWKRRRKIAGKEKRHRENRKRNERIL